jgi:ATP-dependent Lon protease
MASEKQAEALYPKAHRPAATSNAATSNVERSRGTAARRRGLSEGIFCPRRACDRFHPIFRYPIPASPTNQSLAGGSVNPVEPEYLEILTRTLEILTRQNPIIRVFKGPPGLGCQPEGSDRTKPLVHSTHLLCSEMNHMLPVLPIKNRVLFPNLLMPLSVGRPKSIAAIEAAILTEVKEILVITQRDSSVEMPIPGDLFSTGTKAVIKRAVRGRDGKFELLVAGVERGRMLSFEGEEYLRAEFDPVPMPADDSPEIEALHREVVGIATEVLKHADIELPVEFTRVIASQTDPLQMSWLLASVLSMDINLEHSLLAADSRLEALHLIHAHLSHELQILEIRGKIATKAQNEMGKEQRDYFLRQQLRAIQQELGGKEGESELELLSERLKAAELPEEVRKEADREMSRLDRLSPQAPDYNVGRTWLELILELPWNKASDSKIDIAAARQILADDHYGLKEVKERILEHLGVLKLNATAKAPILCFVGPPGVGKTSLGQSIARALGRKFERLSLGGLHDEAELRGHRRTYIGAMAGRIIQSIRRAGVNNPVLMLDEVDKLGRDFRGDPAAALLEILDPEQNKTFRDNYLDLPFDLSKVFFLMTGNTLDTIPQPLLDRMEIVRLAGYSEEEKLEIARRYQVPKQLKEAGLSSDTCAIGDDALRLIISRYTREAGVRQLERAIGRVMRKIALKTAEGAPCAVAIGKDEVTELLGPERFSSEEARKDVPPGVATGLAWTEAGGDVLYIEAALLKDGKGLSITGQLGEVMQESAKIAQSYVWSHSGEFGIDQSLFRRYGVHVHVPAGAIPKDGPSAGVTMTTALTSLYTGLPVRTDTAMTGEVTLSGLVLPVGGIKEKVLAARRLGIRRVIIPRQNEKDLRDLPEDARQEMEFVFAGHVHEVLRAAIPGIGRKGSIPLAA